MAEDVFGIVGTVQAGSFHVERAIAEGGFGVVYRAQHGAFRAPVALKCLKIPVSMTAAQRDLFLEKFREEAEMLFRLSASIPEVVRPLHVDVLHLPDGRVVPFLALEWLEGEPLDVMIHNRNKSGQGPIGAHKLVKLLRPIASALSRAHRFNGPSGRVSIIHRDLKPENIFITNVAGVESVKILDFGIARAKSAATQNAGRVTSEEQLSAFTPAYAAPEQWLPKRFGTTGPWTDVWGLAITMVEALSGKPPIDGDLHAMMATATDDRRRPTPREEGVALSAEADQVFERALAVHPRDRIQDIEVFYTELQAALGVPTGLRERRDDRAEPTGAEADSRSADAAPVSVRRSPAPNRSPELEASTYRHVSAPPSHRRPGPNAATQAAPELGGGEAASATSVGGTPVLGGAGQPPSLELDLPGPSSRGAAPAPRVVGGGAAGGRPAQGAAAAAASVAELPSLELELPPMPRPSDIGKVAPAAPSSAPGAASGAPTPAPSAAADFDDDEPLAIEIGIAAVPTSLRPQTLAPDVATSLSAPPASGPRSLPVPAARASAPSLRAPAEPSPASVASRPTPRPLAEIPASDGGSLGRRLRAPGVLVGLAILITIVDLAVARITGEVLMFGPLRPAWIAGPLLLAGVGLAFQRLAAHERDGG